MGRVASAHSGQRYSFILVALASTEALALFRTSPSNNEIPDSVAKWFHERAAIGNQAQALPLMFQSSKDDLLQVAGGE